MLRALCKLGYDFIDRLEKERSGASPSSDAAGEVEDQAGAWPLDRPILPLSPVDPLTARMAMETILLTGKTGAGKTSGPLNSYLEHIFRQGWGALLHTSKSDDADNYLQIARRCGREADVLAFNPDSSGHKFNFIDYECRHSSRGLPSVENLVAFLLQMLEVADPQRSTRPPKSEDSIWPQARAQFLRSVCTVSLAAKGSVDVETIQLLINTTPLSLDEAASEHFQERSPCAQLIAAAKESTTDPSLSQDILVSETYLLQDLPAMSPETRSSVLMTSTAFMDSLARGWLRDTFCTGETTIPPDLLEDGAIIILDMAEAELGHLGNISQTIYKLSFFNWARRRKVTGDSTRPIAYIADEFPTVCTSDDAKFVALCRSARIAPYLCTQNIPLLERAIGSKEAAQGLIGNCSLRIHLVNQCERTNEWAANGIGKHFQWRGSVGQSDSSNQYPGGGGGSHGSSFNASSQYEYRRDFHEGIFHTLRPGGPPDFIVESFVVKSGVPFRHNGLHHLKVNWPQRTS